MSRWLYMVLLALSMLAVGSCDLQYNAFTNSVPTVGEQSEAPNEIHVFLALDGVSHATLEKARAQGAFSGTKWKSSEFISPFPANSDLGWSRIMRTEKIPSYDYQYYNSAEDKMYSTGYLGVLQHADPFHSLPAHRVFNYHGNGYADKYLIYRQREMSYSGRLDEVFIKLKGISQTSDVFAGYFPETDTRSHMDTEDDIIEMLLMLSEKMETYRSNYPDKKIVYTLFSDHGNDFVRVPVENMVEYDKVMQELGIVPVESLKQNDPNDALYAIPIIHTRVTYIAVFAHEQNEAAIAQKLSTHESVESIVAKSSKPASYTGTDDLEWYAVWKNGKQAIGFGFDATTDKYMFNTADDYQLFDVELPFKTTEVYQSLTDEEVFAATKDSAFPDMFYRIRTSLTKVGIEYPASMILSCKPGYASIGFKIPGGANEIASASFHGALEGSGSTGLVLTEEDIELPRVTRSDNFLDLFPKMIDFITGTRGLEMVDGDANASLDYTQVGN